MNIYLISNAYVGAIAAYTDREEAIHETAIYIILDSYGKYAYTDKTIEKIENDLRREPDYRGYDYWIESIMLHSKETMTEKAC